MQREAQGKAKKKVRIDDNLRKQQKQYLWQPRNQSYFDPCQTIIDRLQVTELLFIVRYVDLSIAPVCHGICQGTYLQQ